MSSPPDEPSSAPAPDDADLDPSPLDLRELATLWAVGANLVFLPWALGGVHAWPQVASLLLSALSLALALLPRPPHAIPPEQPPPTPWSRLIQFPVFWIGLALLLHTTTQALNPAWTYRAGAGQWWMESTPHLSWLPAGIAAPFSIGGPWRALTIHLSAWLTVCAIWIGFTRPRTLRLLFLTLTVSGLLLAALGIAQRMTGTTFIFGFLDSPNPLFFSSFIYGNHAGAYLALVLSLACGLAGWHYQHGLRRLDRPKPAGVIAFFAVCMALAVVASNARGATLAMLAFLLVCGGAFIAHQWRLPSGRRHPVVAIVLVLAFAFFLKTGFEALDSTGTQRASSQRAATPSDAALARRDLLTTATLEMLSDSPTTGFGAGSFRFLFPIYQAKHPDLVTFEDRHLHWEHAHNDILQFPIELGAIGTLLLLAALGAACIALMQASCWTHPFAAGAALGGLILLAYSWWDFPFQCPAIFVTWCALWPAAILWARFEKKKPAV